MTSSLRHKTKFWDLFLQKLKVQSNIYRMVGWNELDLKCFRSCSQLKMSNFDGRERDSREQRVGYRNISYTYVIVPWLKVRREGFVHYGTFLGCCVLLLDDVICCCMFQWRSGALARAQTYICSRFNTKEILKLYLWFDTLTISDGNMTKLGTSLSYYMLWISAFQLLYTYKQHWQSMVESRLGPSLDHLQGRHPQPTRLLPK